MTSAGKTGSCFPDEKERRMAFFLQYVFRIPLPHKGVGDLPSSVRRSGNGLPRHRRRIFYVSTSLFRRLLAGRRQRVEEPAEADRVYVGDTVSRDIIGAKRAGFGWAAQIYSFLTAQKDVGIPITEAERPDVVIQNFEEFLAWLDQENPAMTLK